MNYQETIQYIHQMPKFSRELGNRLLAKLLLHCGNPEKELKFIHVAGTNGKGSISIMLAEILQRAGYKVGLYTSPYIERFNERIQINRASIPDDALARIVTNLRYIIETHDAPVSEFALDTAAAFCWFLEQKTDVVVLETGLGGRLDATNIIPENLACVIGAIGLDHTQYLGDTLEKITAEKCGIIKHQCPVVCYPQQEDVCIPVIKEYAAKNQSALHVADLPHIKPDGMTVKGEFYELGLKGDFQAYNAATVLKTIEVLKQCGIIASQDAIHAGLLMAANPARFERFGETVILDGAHNPHAIRALCNTLKNTHHSIYFCTAMMEDKDISSCVELLAKYAKGVVTTQIDMPRCCPARMLAEKFSAYGVSTIAEANPQKAVEKAISFLEKDDVLCICGSLYLAGELRPYLKEL